MQHSGWPSNAEPRVGSEYSSPRWQPAVDVYRTKTGWLIKLEVAGIRHDEVDVKVSGKTLTVRGRRVDQLIERGTVCHLLEIVYSEFERRIELPSEMTSPSIELSYRDGILLIRVQTENSQS